MVATDCGESYYMVMSSVGGQVFANMQRTLDGTSAMFGQIQPYIEVELKNCSSGDTSLYSPGDDEIRICAGHVWSAYGVFIVSHEYGHAFHQTTLWGNNGGSCPTPHHLDTGSNLTCAFSEGFADYFLSGHATRCPGLFLPDRVRG